MTRWVVAAIALGASASSLACGRKSCLDGDCEATRPCEGLRFECAVEPAPELFIGRNDGLPAGRELVNGQAGDAGVALSNGVVTAVLNAIEAPIDLGPTGGNLVDFGVVGGRDDLTIVYQLAGILPEDALAYDELEIVDRRPDYVAAIVRGHLDGRPEVKVATRYELRPCEPGLRVRSELFNGSPDDQAFVLADALHLGKRRTVPFTPVAGQGYQQPELDLLELTELWKPYAYVGGATPQVDGAAMGIVSCTAPEVHGVADLEIMAVGTPIELVRPGDSLVLERFVVAGADGGGPATAVDALLSARNQLHGDAAPMVVTGHVTADGLDFGGDVRRGSMMIFAEGAPATVVVPGADGQFRASAPGEGALTWELWSFGRKVAEGAVPEGGAIGDIAIDPPATLQLAVTLDAGAGPAEPAHALVVVEPADDATRTAVAGTLHGRLTKCAPWLGPPDGGSPACNRVLVEPAGTEVEVPPGHYWIYASAGPAATLARSEVTLVAGEITPVALALRTLPLVPAGWLGADLHVHGRRSFDSGIPDLDRVRSFVTAGVDVIAATDHDVIGDYSAALVATQLDDRLLVMGGLETTQIIPWLDVPGEDLPKVIGHFNFWPLTALPGEPRAGAPDDEGIEPGALFDRLDAQLGPGGVRMINHPWDETQFGRDLGYLRAIGFDPRRPLDEGNNAALLGAPGGGLRNLDWNVMEVQNGAGADEYAKARTLWFSMINAGFPTAGAANSDSHGLRDSQLGWGRTWVETGTALADTTPDAFNSALRAGHVTAGSGVFVDVTVGPPGGPPRRGLGLEPIVPQPGDVLTITVRAAPWIPVGEVRAFTSTGERVLVGIVGTPVDPFGEVGVVRVSDSFPLDSFDLAADDWIVIQAGMPLPPYLDLDDDGVVDTGDNDQDGDVDDADIEPDEDTGPITNPPDPTDPQDPRFHMTRIVPESWPIGFTSPLLIDAAGDGWSMR